MENKQWVVIYQLNGKDMPVEYIEAGDYVHALVKLGQKYYKDDDIVVQKVM